MNTILPFEPETVVAMQKRWPDIFITRFELKLIESGGQNNPVFLRRHVFDFPDGIRMVASVEDHSEMQDEHETFKLHLSFGIIATFHEKWIQRGQLFYAYNCNCIVRNWQAAGLITGECTDTDVTDRACHYWFKYER